MIYLDKHLTRVTVEQARDWLAHDLFEGQRAVRLWHAGFLAELMRAGKFRRGSKIEFCEFDGRRYLVDGQHTLTAIVLCRLAQDLLPVVRPVARRAEIGEVYATFGRELQRQPGDVFAALGLARQLDFGAADLKMLNGAVRLVLNRFRRVSVMLDARIARDASFIAGGIEERQVPARLYLAALGLAPKPLVAPLRHHAVVAVALATLGAESEEVRKKALEFWEQVAMSDGLRRGDPRKALTDWLLRGTSHDAVTHAAYVAAAWNAFYEGKSLDLLRPIDMNKSGLTLRGTAFKATVPRRNITTPRRHSGGDEAAPMPAPAAPRDRPLPLAAKAPE